MSTAPKSDWYIIVNPHAGSGKTMSRWVIAEKRLEELNVNYVAVFTRRVGHARELARSAASDGYRKFLAVGGDGSVHEMFSGVHDYMTISGAHASEFKLGVIPIGSGNDWIKTTHIPKDTEGAINALASGYFIDEDMVLVKSTEGECVMANVGGVGFDSRVCVTVNRQKARGMRSSRIYINALLSTILKLKPFNVKIVADSLEVFSGRCYSIAFGNGQYSGGGMRQTPDARIDDGLLDVLIVPAIPLLSIFKDLHRLLDGSIRLSRNLIYLRCHSIDIAPLDIFSDEAVETDGEITGRLPLSVEVTGEKFKVLSSRR